MGSMDTNAEMTPLRELNSSLKTLRKTDVHKIKISIDQFNTYASNCQMIDDNEITEEFFLNLTSLMTLKNSQLLSKFCKTICILLNKRKILLNAQCQKSLIDFMVSAVYSCDESIKSDVLIALATLISSSCYDIGQFQDALIGDMGRGSLSGLVIFGEHDKYVQYNALQCVLCLLRNPIDDAITQKTLNTCFQKCLLILKDKCASDMANVLVLKILVCALKILQQIYISKHVPVNNFGELLGALKGLLFYGLPGQVFFSGNYLIPTLKCPDATHTHESMSESDSSHPKIKKQKKNRRKSKKTPHKKQQQHLEDDSKDDVTSLHKDFSIALLLSPKQSFDVKTWSSSSDSEFSDAENRTSKIKIIHASIRRNSYLSLHAIIKTSDKKLVFSYWSSFLPEHPAMPGMTNSQNIFTTILKDHIPEVRLAALSLLTEMLRNSKQFLLHADGRNAKSMSFTSLSSILASMIGEIHRSLLLALVSENNTSLLIQILKCFAVLTENVPYVKLNTDILTKLMKHLKSHLYHSDIQVQVASLSVFGSIINSDQLPSEIDSLLLCSDFESTLEVVSSNLFQENCLQSKDDSAPWIVGICKINIYSEEALPLKIQSLNLLSILLGKYFLKSRSFLPVIMDIILSCFNSPDTTLQLYGAKILDVLGRCMNNSTNSQGLGEIQEQVSSLWRLILSGKIIQCLNNTENKPLQAICCDCLSSLSASEFEMLSEKLQVIYITIFLGLSTDSNPNVRGSAIRCLGLYCLFPCLSQDPSFLDDLSVILIKSTKDQNVNVRFKASWALGNLSDILPLYKDTTLNRRHISPLFFYSTGMACIEFSKDCDRVKANAVRALGNFLHFVPNDFINLPTIQEFVQKACNILQGALTVNFMKVCWNACYALGNMFKNTSLMEQSFVNKEDLITSLLGVLKSPNFKVRISASQSLTSLTSRKLYGQLLPLVWIHLISSLSSVTKDVNFKEMKHQENLCDQLCFSFTQLASLMMIEDVKFVAQEITEARDILGITMSKFGSRLTVQKSSQVFTAVENLHCLKQENKNTDEEETVTVLLDIFNQATTAFQDEANLEI